MQRNALPAGNNWFLLPWYQTWKCGNYPLKTKSLLWVHEAPSWEGRSPWGGFVASHTSGVTVLTEEVKVASLVVRSPRQMRWSWLHWGPKCRLSYWNEWVRSERAVRGASPPLLWASSASGSIWTQQTDDEVASVFRNTWEMAPGIRESPDDVWDFFCYLGDQWIVFTPLEFFRKRGVMLPTLAIGLTSWRRLQC